MARCGCGGAACSCSVVAGEGITVAGSGSIASPFIISALDPDCEEIRPCLSQGNGITYSVGTGVIAARLSGLAGNTATIGGDGGIYVPPAACSDVRPCISAGSGASYSSVTGVVAARRSTDANNILVFGGDTGLYVSSASVACGLTGDGRAGTPLAAKVSAWPYACPLEANASQVYCDNTGTLRAEPRGRSDFVQQFNSTNYANVAVPTGTPVTIITDTLNIPNPDPCRAAQVIVEVEVDVDMNFPAASGAAWGIAADDMQRLENRGSATMTTTHWQLAKVYRNTIPAGGSVNDALEVRLGSAFGSPTYSRIQTTHRAWTFNL